MGGALFMQGCIQRRYNFLYKGAFRGGGRLCLSRDAFLGVEGFFDQGAYSATFPNLKHEQLCLKVIPTG